MPSVRLGSGSPAEDASVASRAGIQQRRARPSPSSVEGGASRVGGASRSVANRAAEKGWPSALRRVAISKAHQPRLAPRHRGVGGGAGEGCRPAPLQVREPRMGPGSGWRRRGRARLRRRASGRDAGCSSCPSCVPVDEADASPRLRRRGDVGVKTSFSWQAGHGACGRKGRAAAGKTAAAVGLPAPRACAAAFAAP